MRFLFVSLIGLVLSCGQAPSSQLGAHPSAGSFPTKPSPEITQGSLCQVADEYRYAEHIVYCERNVSPETKQGIIAEYDRRFGYSVGSMNRMDFKIDHYLPLFMGGSNSRDNLWPQHKSIYGITDPIESKLSTLMVRGSVKQAHAIELIKKVKCNLKSASAINDELDKLLHE